MGPELLRELRDKEGVAYVVRPFESRDRPALDAMYHDFEPKRVAQGLPPGSPAGVKRWLDQTLPNGRHWLIEDACRCVGHLMLMPMSEDASELANFLHQSVRNRGIGTALNAFALDRARAVGRRRVWLSVEPWNRAAIRSYEKVGFRRLPGSLWSPEIEMEAVL